MKTANMAKWVLVSLAVLGFCLPQPVLAATASGESRPVVVDVALMDGGMLVGQVVDPQGAPLAKTSVSVWSQAKQIGVAVTDENGRFAVGGLRNGVYQVVAAEGHGAYRLWTPGVAPPSAQRGALLVAGKGAVRGQDNPWCSWLTNPWVIAGIVATAVAVPVALANSKSSSSP